jgi:D-alanine-D-alanine ligase
VNQPAVIFGGPSPEHDISILTGLLVARGLSGAGPVHCLYWSKTGEWWEVDAHLEGRDFVDGVPKKSRPLRLLTGPGGGFVGDGGALRKERPLDISAAIVCCHGAPGEDGTLQAALDLAGVVYAGPSVSGAALGMDKLAFGAVMATAGIPCLPRVLASPDEAPPFRGPYMVKPRFGGSSIGIEVATDGAAVAALLRNSVHLRAGGVVEPYRGDATEVQIAVRAHPAVTLSNLLEPKRGSGSGAFYSYQEKYVPGEGMHAAEAQIDPDLPTGVPDALRAAAVAIVGLAGVRGVARIDFLVDGVEWYVNEINTIPGSLSKHLWVDPAVPLADLLAGLLAEAVARPTASNWTTAGADGTALRSAGDIQGKLG